MTGLNIVIVTGIFPPDIGGPAQYVPVIAEALQARGHHVEVITLADEPGGDHANRSYDVHRISRKQNRLVRMLGTARTIRRLSRHADVLYLNGLVLEGTIAALLCGKPVVTKVVGDLMWERAQRHGRTESLDEFQIAALPLHWRALRRLQAIYTGRSRRIITPSRYLQGIVSGWGISRDRITVVYNAIPPIDVGNAARGPETFDLVTVGRLVPWKGIDELIRVCATKDWRLLVIGDGPLKESLESLSTSLQAKVTFRGRVPQEDVPDLMRLARIFVLNSTYEGLPHIVLEAKVAGLPVVATSAGGTPECVEDGVDGILVPVGHSKKLELAIARLLADPALRQRLAHAGRRNVGMQFSHERMVDQTEHVLLEAARTP